MCYSLQNLLMLVFLQMNRCTLISITDVMIKINISSCGTSNHVHLFSISNLLQLFFPLMLHSLQIRIEVMYKLLDSGEIIQGYYSLGNRVCQVYLFIILTYY